MTKKTNEEKEINWQEHLPLCPHCSEELHKVNAHVLLLERSIPFSSAQFGKRDRCIVTSCPSCRKVLGTYDYYEE